jgi:hypothetical protein
MVNDKKQQQDHLQEVVKTIGRALRREFETEGKDVPVHIRQLLDQLEAKGKPKKEE